MKYLFRRIFTIYNIFPIVIIAMILLVPLGVTDKIGLSRENLLYAILSVLAIDSLVLRVGVLRDIGDAVSSLTTAVRLSHRELFIPAGSNSVKLHEHIREANQIILCGITLNRTITTHSEFLLDRINKGCKLKIAILNPDLSLHGVHCAAKSSLNLQSVDLIATHIDTTLKTISSLYDRVDPRRRKNIQLYFVDFPPPYSIIAINGNETQGIIQVRLYGCKVDPGNIPLFWLRDPQENWFRYFYAQAVKMVECGGEPIMLPLKAARDAR